MKTPIGCHRDKQTVVHPNIGQLLSNKKQGATNNTSINMDDC